MTKEEQRIAIAEFEGWRFVPSHDHPVLHTAVGDTWYSPDENELACEQGLPDYLNSLDAMHEVEKKILDLRTPHGTYAWNDYLDYLEVKTGNRVHATASQRAEALLRTIGKWKD